MNSTEAMALLAETEKALSIHLAGFRDCDLAQCEHWRRRNEAFLAYTHRRHSTDCGFSWWSSGFSARIRCAEVGAHLVHRGDEVAGLGSTFVVVGCESLARDGQWG